MSRHWFLFGLFTLPFVFWPWASISYEIPKVWFFNRWVEVLAVLALAENLKSKNGPDRKLLLLLISFTVVALLSSVLGANFGKSFWGNYYRGDGLLTLFHLIAFSILAAILWRKNWTEGSALALGTSAVTISALSILAFLKTSIFGSPDMWGGIGATFGQPKFLAGFLLVTMPFTAYLAGKKSYWSMGLGVQIIAIFLTKSLGGIFGAVIFFLLLGYFLKKFSLKPIAALTLLVILGSLVFYFALHSSAVSKNELGYQSRSEILTRGFQGFLKKPLLGYGWANFDYAFEAGGGNYNKNVYVDKAHSHVLEILSTGGMVGLLIYAGILALVFKNLLPGPNRRLTWRKTLFISFLLFLFHSQTNVISLNEELFFWLILGIAASKKAYFT
ncbi:MAG: O-antigen ligase family protein [Candidatus Blackburnbacteria bacterium]|nr:O-antigen ligase family protein [Candidatus Blackburnbacteria bacterium]